MESIIDVGDGYMNLENVYRIRKQKNISVTDMTKLLGLKAESAYYKKEKGYIKFSLLEARMISLKFGMSIEDIFFRN